MPHTVGVMGSGEHVCQKYYKVEKHPELPRKVDVVHAPNGRKCIVELHHMARRVPYHGEGRGSKNDEGIALVVRKKGRNHCIVVWQGGQDEQWRYQGHYMNVR